MNRYTLTLFFTVIFFNFVFLGQTLKGKYLPGQFGKLKYDKVVVYDFVPQKNQGIVIGNKINNSLVVKKEVALTKQQADTLNNILFNTVSYGTYPPNCVNTHFGIIYFKENKIVASINISFDCNCLLPSLEIEAMKVESFSDKKYSFAYYDGLSKNGVEKLRRFCNQLDFTKY